VRATRRAFLGAAAAFGVLGASPAPAGRIRVGYQIYGWGRHFPAAWWRGAEAVGALGFRGIEGEYTIAECYEGREQEFVDRMQRCGVTLAALYSTTDLERSHERRENLRKNLHAAAFCERAGGRMIVLGGTEAKRKDPESFAAYVKEADELGRRLLETASGSACTRTRAAWSRHATRSRA